MALPFNESGLPTSAWRGQAGAIDGPPKDVAVRYAVNRSAGELCLISSGREAEESLGVAVGDRVALVLVDGRRIDESAAIST